MSAITPSNLVNFKKNDCHENNVCLNVHYVERFAALAMFGKQLISVLRVE